MSRQISELIIFWCKFHSAAHFMLRFLKSGAKLQQIIQNSLTNMYCVEGELIIQ